MAIFFYIKMQPYLLTWLQHYRTFNTFPASKSVDRLILCDSKKSIYIFVCLKTVSPTCPLAILEPLNKEMGEIYAAQEGRATDFEAPELWKRQSGGLG